jgi:lysophospholipase L1-like esterase
MILLVLLPAAPLSDGWRQLALTGALLIGVNTLVTPFLPASAPTLTPNYFRRVQFTSGLTPGMNGVQTITTDAKGYRTNRPIDYEHKPAGAFRVFAIGGSTTEQIVLGDDKTWVSILAADLERRGARRVEAVNTGVSGLRAEHHLATLRAIAGYQPDLVIVMMGLNDWNQHIRRGAASRFVFFHDMVERLDVRRSIMGQAARAVRTLVSSGSGRDDPELKPPMDQREFLELGSPSLERRDRREFHPAAVAPDYEHHAREIASFCRSHGLRCMFVDQATAYHPGISAELMARLWMTPSKVDYTLSLENMGRIAELYNSTLHAIAQDSGTAFCGISRLAAPTTAFFYDDCHFNEPGARAVAAMLADCVLAQRVGP